jgi:hypothetical protein
MSSLPTTNREYAYFYISGPGTHESISERLGLQPSQGWNAGDPTDHPGFKRGAMRWQMDSGLNHQMPLASHIESLVFTLATRELQLKELWLDYDLVIECVGYYPPSGHGVHFSREVIRKCARLGVALDLDFYYREAPDLTE